MGRRGLRKFQFGLIHLMGVVTFSAFLLSLCAVLGLFSPPAKQPPHWLDFWWAVGGGDKDEVARLIALGIDVNETNLQGESVVYHAAELDRADIVPILIKAGANVNAAAKDKTTALHVVSRYLRSFSSGDVSGKAIWGILAKLLNS